MDLRWARSKLIALDMDPLLAARLLVLPRALPRLGLVVLLLLLLVFLALTNPASRAIRFSSKAR